jgi:hypothetical protein
MEQEIIDLNRGLLPAIVSLTSLAGAPAIASCYPAALPCSSVSQVISLHDVHFLGMDKEQLCRSISAASCILCSTIEFHLAAPDCDRLVVFVAGRVSLRAGECWAWWAFLLSGITGL